MQPLKSLLSLVFLAPIVVLAGPVDINSADAKTLSKELKGIGPARAEAIVRYRTQNGPFKSADELALVKSIPQKVIEANRADIRVERAGATTTAAAAAAAAKARTAAAAHAPSASAGAAAQHH